MTTDLWQLAGEVKAVICETPHQLNEHWVVMNAPRPLLGDVVTDKGEFLHGYCYAAINPDIEFAVELFKRNLKVDAKVVFFASPELVDEMAYELCSPKYRERLNKMGESVRSDQLEKYRDQLRTGWTHKELAAFASLATSRINENIANYFSAWDFSKDAKAA